MIPSLLLQPIVENAVKYAVEPYSDKGCIKIDIDAANGSLNISVSDNGKMDFNEIDFSSGIGLANTKGLKQLYADKHTFAITPNTSGKGVTVTIEIPDQTSEDASVKNFSS